jgi:hypothetical protein
MPIYKVLHNHILHDGVLYEPGKVIELKEEEAEGLRVALSADADIRDRSQRKGKK